MNYRIVAGEIHENASAANDHVVIVGFRQKTHEGADQVLDAFESRRRVRTVAQRPQTILHHAGRFATRRRS